MFKPSFICKTLSQFQRGTRTSYTYSAFKLSRWGAKKAGITTLCAVGTLFGTSYFVLYGASNDEDKKKKLVILGSGWGAVSLLKFLDSNKYDVSVISPENYFLLTPLLPGVTVGTVEGRSIIEPIRKYLSKSHKEDTTFYEAECTHVDVEKNQVVCKDLSKITGLKEEFTLDYDYLVVAIGAQTATYNIKGVAEHTHFLKTVKQAQTIRKNILDSFETAALPGQPDYEQRRLLHFVVVGGGPTGVEFAAELRDYVKHDLSKYYPKDLIDKSKITLVDGLNKILNTYSEEISRYASSRFKNEGIDIVTNTFVTNVEKNTMHLLDSKTKEKSQMAYGMCVWCAGISPRDLTKQLINDIPGQRNRFALITDGHFKVNNSRNIFAVGDCSTIQNDEFISIIEQIIQRNDEKATLTTEQVQGFLDDSMKKFPKFCHQFKRMKRDLDNDPQESLTIQALRKLASKTLTQETALPPTAQVAAQEGKYLGKLLSNYKYEIGEKDCSDIPIFTYRHLGSFAYVGDNHAVLEFPVVGSLMGWSSMWLWRGTYANECVSYRMRALVVLDWIKSYIFGRDTSRI